MSDEQKAKLPVGIKKHIMAGKWEADDLSLMKSEEQNRLASYNEIRATVCEFPLLASPLSPYLVSLVHALTN